MQFIERLAKKFRVAATLLPFAIAGCVSLGAPLREDRAPKDTNTVCAALQRTLDEIRKEAGFPGATAALSLEDGTLCEAATGLADTEQSITMRIDHMMPAGSIGKTFVAASVLSLIEDGALTYDSKAKTWLGHYDWYAEWPNAQDITVGHLVTHSSGVATDYIEQSELLAIFNKAIAEDTTLNALGVTHEDYAKSVSRTEPAFSAGDGFHYTDVSYVLAGLIVEAVSGGTLESYVATKFTSPLGLAKTRPQKRDMRYIAAGYIPEPYRQAFGGVPEKSLKNDGTFVYDPEFEWGGGGYVSTAGDLALWARAWFGGSALPGGYLDIQRSNIDMRAAETLRAGYGPGVQYLPDTEFGERYFHRGYMLGYISVTDYLLDHDISVSLMINTIDTSYTTYHDELVRVVVEELSDE